MKIDKDQLIKVIDFWRRSVEMDDLLNRKALDEIKIKGREIVDLIGPRRSGKSSILKLLIGRMKLSDGFLYINFEDPFFIENNGPAVIEELISVFEEYFGGLKYLFFDEIQEIKLWEKAVRKLRDGGDYKIFVTGSSSKLLSGELGTLLTGRHESHLIYPLSFKEFLEFKKIILPSRKDMVLKERKIKAMFDEYLEIGGFPEVVKESNPVLSQSYFSDILQKDVVARYDIRDKETLEKMAVYLISNAGNTVSVESLKNLYRISFEAASNYLDYLKEAMLIFELVQFSYSLKKQTKSLKKYYAVDTGLANNVSFRFSEDRGRILENAIYLELRKRNNKEEMFYYKTKNNLEVDFFLREKAKPKSLIQSAWTIADKKTKERELKALTQAMSELKIASGLILTYDEEDEIERNGKKITVKPLWKWALE